MSSVLWEEPGAINKAKTILHNHLTNATGIVKVLRKSVRSHATNLIIHFELLHQNSSYF